MEKTLRFGKYQLLRRVAVGGMAELFLGKITGDQGFEKLVAIKCILPQFCAQPEVVQAFVDEAKIAAFLQHENIVQIYDFGCLGERYFMAMEYLSGKDLRRLLDRCQDQGMPLPLAHALEIAVRVCTGLDYAHRLTDYRGRPLHIVHRDVSPQNVLICYSGLVKILDFGIAKAAGRSSCTQSGVIKGKTAYMAPEQAMGKPVDHRSDIFALGVLLYELVTGRRMFEGEAMVVLERVRKMDHVPVRRLAPGLPGELYRILDRALAADPAARYGTCREMLSDLEAVASGLPERPGTRGLGRFLRHLFATEMQSEDKDLQGAMPHERAMPPGATAMPLKGGGSGSRGTVTLVTEPDRPRAEDRPGLLFVGAVGVAICFIGLAMFAFRVPDAGQPAGRGPATGASSRETAAAPRTLTADLGAAIPPSGGGAVEDLLAEVERLAEKRPEEAILLLRQGLKTNPDDTRLLFQLGLAHMRNREYDAAVAAFSRAIEIDDSLYNARFNMAFAYAASGDDAAAERAYQEVVDAAPPYLDEALYNLAIVQERLGKRDAAIRQLDLAVRFNPHNIPAINYLYRLRGRQEPTE